MGSFFFFSHHGEWAGEEAVWVGGHAFSTEQILVCGGGGGHAMSHVLMCDEYVEW